MAADKLILDSVSMAFLKVGDILKYVFPALIDLKIFIRIHSKYFLRNKLHLLM